MGALSADGSHAILGAALREKGLGPWKFPSAPGAGPGVLFRAEEFLLYWMSHGAVVRF